MKLPSREQAVEILKKNRVLPNILEHSFQVNNVAVFLAKKLIKAGEKIDIDVVDRASLLHDVGKSITILDKIKDRHHELAEDILTVEGYPELGLVCRRHSLMELKNLHSWEEKIVNYADTRVKHNRIVSLKERIEDLTRRYKVPESQRLTLRDLLPLENEIFSKLRIKPEDIGKMVEKSDDSIAVNPNAGAGVNGK